MKSNLLFLFVLIIFLTSCSKKNLETTDYVSWVENESNGLSVTKELDDIKYRLLYKPVDYVVAKELINNAIKKNEVESRKKELGNMNYFTLRIESKKSEELMRVNIKSEDEYYHRLEYFMGYMQDDIYLVDGTDTINPSLFHFERNYGLAPFNDFVLGFNKSNRDPQDLYFIYNDQVLGTGKISIKINKDDISNVPNIIMK
jgi:hypothetical protein